MNKRTLLFFVIALFLSACSGAGTATANPTPAVTETPTLPAFLQPVSQVTIFSASYTITAKDPTHALASLQQAVKRAGGYVDSASSYSSQGSSGYASLSAKVPPEAMDAFNISLERIAVEIQNQNLSVQDVTEDMLKLQQRHSDLSEAQDAVVLMLINKQDLHTLASFRLMEGLLDSELKSVESQLFTYQEQAKLANVSISINQAGNVPPPVNE